MILDVMMIFFTLYLLYNMIQVYLAGKRIDILKKECLELKKDYKNKVKDAYEFLNDSIVFAVPIFDKFGNIINFYNNFDKMVEIYPLKNGKIAVEPSYCYCIKCKVPIYHYESSFETDSWEDAILKLYNIVKSKSDKVLIDYYNVKDDRWCEKLPNGNFKFISGSVDVDVKRIFNDIVEIGGFEYDF